MPLEHIQDFLAKYRQYFSNKDEELQKIHATVLKVSGIQLASTEFSVERGAIVINGNSVLKNELFMNKEQILRALHEDGVAHINEIR